MLRDEDRIFKNLYNDNGSDFKSASKEVTGQMKRNISKR